MRIVQLGLAFAFSMGCIPAPEIVVVDRATVLEEQAAGSFDEIERRLDRAGIAPRPVPLTPEQLRLLGMAPPPLVDNAELTSADRVDGLLVRHCVGEARDGLLVETRAACQGAEDAEETGLLVERVNRARLELWRWMQTRRPGASAEALRKSWRELHAHGLGCGAWVQHADGSWEAKKC